MTPRSRSGPGRRSHHRPRECSHQFFTMIPTQVSASEKNELGMVVIRGNSVVMIEALEKLWGE